MQPFLQNKYVRFVGGGLAVSIVLFVLFIAVALGTSGRSISLGDQLNLNKGGGYGYTNSISGATMMERSQSFDSVESDSAYYPQPMMPVTGGGYVAGLEDYEITNYSVSARTKQFDELCQAVNNLKSDAEIHFKTINTSLNNCYATFYVQEEKVTSIIDNLNKFSGVEMSRNTESVTKQKERLQSQSDILRQQLASVSNSLNMAETQLDEIANFARSTNDAKTLSLTIREKLSLIDTLTQRKIQLTNQLDQLLKQSAELNERIGVIEFNINISRSNPIIVGEKSTQWETALDNLNDEFTNTLIGISIFLGVFLLWIFRGLIYLLILLVVLRMVWKFIKMVWKW